MTASTIAPGRATRVALVAETTFGTTPSTPSFTTLRVTDSSLRPRIQKGQSREFTTDRMDRGGWVEKKWADGSLSGHFTPDTYDLLLQAAFGGTWSSNQLATGDTFRSFTIEERYAKAGQFQRFVGAVVSAFELDCPANGTIGVSFDIMAREMVPASSAITGATYSTPNTLQLPGATGGISSVSWTGISSTPIVRSFKMRVENNIEERPVFDDPRTVEFGVGMQDITGELVVYFDDKGIYDEIAYQSSAALTFTMLNIANKKYTLALPKMEWGDGALDARTRNGSVTLTMPFTAVYDANSGTHVLLTRAVA